MADKDFPSQPVDSIPTPPPQEPSLALVEGVPPKGGPTELRKQDGSLKNPKHGKRGPDKRSRTRRTSPITLGDQITAATMAAQGAGARMIAPVINRSLVATRAILAKAEVQERIKQIREATRTQSVAIVQQAQDKVGDWLHETIEARDPKAFDNVTRGMAALEKVSSSASGEARRIESLNLHQHNVSVDARVEIRELLSTLLGEVIPAEPA